MCGSGEPHAALGLNKTLLHRAPHVLNEGVTRRSDNLLLLTIQYSYNLPSAKVNVGVSRFSTVDSQSPRVAVIANAPAPYTTAVYRQVSYRANVNLNVFYCSGPHRNRPQKWKDGTSDYQSTVLRGIHLYLRGSGRDPIHVNPSIFQSLSRFEPDAIVVGGYSNPTMLAAIIFAETKGIPYVLSMDGVGTGGNMLWIRPCLRVIVERASSYIAGADDAANFLIDLGADPKRVFVVPCVTDLRHLNELAMTRSTTVLGNGTCRRNESKTVLFVGRLVQEKGILDLIEAFAKLRESGAPLRLKIVGKGPIKGLILRLIQPYRDCVTQIDYIDSIDEMVDTFVESDVLVLPSLREPFGIVAPEVYVCGIPVVVSDRCGCRTILPRSPWVTIFRAGDVDTLVTSMNGALQLDARSGSRARSEEVEGFVRQYSVSELASGFERAVLRSIEFSDK